MVLFNHFFFVFSLRLGSIIIGVITIIKCSVWLTLNFWGLETIDHFTECLKNVTEKQSVLGPLADKINLYTDLKYYLIGLASLYGLIMLVCILHLIGTYQCNLKLIYPFLLFYALYKLLLCLDMTMVYALVTRNNRSLEIVITFFSCAIFIFVYHIYTWCCVYSFVQVIKILRKQALQRTKLQIFKQAVTIPKVKKYPFSKK